MGMKTAKLWFGIHKTRPNQQFLMLDNLQWNSPYTSYGCETTIVEHLEKSQSCCSSRSSLKVVQQNTPYCSLIHTSLEVQGYTALTPYVSQVSKRSPSLADSCIDLVCHTTIRNNKTSNISKALHNFECLPWILSCVFKDCMSRSVTLHFVGAKRTFPVPSCHATQRKHEGWDTARVPKPRQGKSRGRGRVRTTDLPKIPGHSLMSKRVKGNRPVNRVECALEIQQYQNVTFGDGGVFLRDLSCSTVLSDIQCLSARDGSVVILTGRCVVRTRPLPLDFSFLGLGNLAVSQHSCFLLVARQLGTQRALQLNSLSAPEQVITHVPTLYLGNQDTAFVRPLTIGQPDMRLCECRTESPQDSSVAYGTTQTITPRETAMTSTAAFDCNEFHTLLPSRSLTSAGSIPLLAWLCEKANAPGALRPHKHQRPGMSLP
ncbi:hypothetical protein CSKR_105737 [Clonorchis sinensis]|uniref:Uncharacterized protein n=1 Tax=Clonorchis sinensis TaxID=79923 RepID=A0A3R7F778_CLOSI|nr:hypothetical protein CSKR_105737 [Clonorchis sinensis]